LNLTVNGESRSFSENINLKELILNLEIESKVMAAAVNMEVVKKENWEECILKDSDKVELLNFVGGG